MSHPRNRAHRRHHRERLIFKRVKQRPSWFLNLDHHAQPDRFHAKQRGRLASTPTPCSCWMCGNPRRHLNQRTLAEHKADLAGRDGLACDTMEP